MDLPGGVRVSGHDCFDGRFYYGRKHREILFCVSGCIIIGGCHAACQAGKQSDSDQSDMLGGSRVFDGR